MASDFPPMLAPPHASALLADCHHGTFSVQLADPVAAIPSLVFEPLAPLKKEGSLAASTSPDAIDVVPLVVNDMKRHHSALCQEEERLNAMLIEADDRKARPSHGHGTRTAKVVDQRKETIGASYAGAVAGVTEKRRKLGEMLKFAKELADDFADVRPSAQMRAKSGATAGMVDAAAAAGSAPKSSAALHTAASAVALAMAAPAAFSSAAAIRAGVSAGVSSQTRRPE